MSRRPPRLHPDDSLREGERVNEVSYHPPQSSAKEPIVPTVHRPMSEGEKELQWMAIGAALVSSVCQAKLLDMPSEGWSPRAESWREAIQAAASGDESELNDLLKARGIERRGRVIDDLIRTVHEYLRVHAMESAAARMKAAMRLLDAKGLAAWMREEAARVDAITGPRIAEETRKEAVG